MSASRCVAVAFVLVVLVLSFAVAMSSAWAQAPQHAWSQRFGDIAAEGESIAVDGSGNVIVTGYFMGAVDFGGGPLTDPNLSLYDYDIFVAKFDAAGTHVWSQRFGDEAYQWGTSVAADDSGNVVVSGRFEGSVDFGGGALTSAGSYDIFLAKFDADGNHVWSQRFGNENEQYVDCVAVGSSGDVFVTGGIFGVVDFGGDPLTSAGSYDIFLAKFDGGGNHLWSQRFGGVDSDGGSSVAVDDAGSVVVTGAFQDNVDFGGGPLNSAGSWDIFVAKFDGYGNHVWSQRFGDASWQGSKCVAVDDSENVIVTGDFRGTVDFGGGALTSAGFDDIYVVKLDGTGSHVWSQRFGDEVGQYGNSVAVDVSGNVIIAGVIGGLVDFGGGSLANGGVCLAKFDGTGRHVWSQCFGSSQCGDGVAVDGLGAVIVTGGFGGTVDFGGGSLEATGNLDIFVAKFDYGTTPTLLHGFSATAREAGIEVSWGLIEAGVDMEFRVLRADFARTRFQDLHNPSISQENLSFTFVDDSCLPGSTYRYRVDVSDEDGWNTLFETEAITARERTLALNQNHPNPFNPSTTITFTLADRVRTRLSIYDIAGKRVATLVDQVLEGGLRDVTWNGRDDQGNPVSSGVYFYRLTAGKQTLEKKLVLLK